MNDKSQFNEGYAMYGTNGIILCLKCGSGNIRYYQEEYFCNNCGLMFCVFEGEK
jgi:hypothetical protein